METPHGRAAIDAVFGNPARRDGMLNEAWEGENIRKVAPPDGWELFYQSDEGLVRVSGVRMHRLLEDSFHAALEDVWAEALRRLGGGASNADVRAFLHELRLDQHGGGFNFRKITGGRALSLHAYGIAIDWDPEHNPRRKPLTQALPDWWFAIWNRRGWSDGRGFATPDPMHVQFATGA
jgi:D-alanyl-D-alanine carboxypeptidase-like protein